MKKILLPLEGGYYSNELMDFVRILQTVGHVQLTAVLVPQQDYAAMPEDGVAAVAEQGPCHGEEEKVARHQCRRLEKACAASNIKCKRHPDREDFALPCLRKESRYADLILLSGRHFFDRQDSAQPNAWMKDILYRSECPLLLLPDEASLPGELILAYDGSADSAFAIRQFAYLFPEFSAVRTTLVYVNDDPKAKLPEEAAIRELCALHFKKFRVLKLRTRTADFYDTWVGMMKDPWVITGSFGRSGLSPLFSGNFSVELIDRRKVTIFVAHR